MKAVLDACVLYPTVLREVLLAVAEEGAFTPLWSPRIEREWVLAAMREGGDPEAEAAGLNARFPAAMVDLSRAEEEAAEAAYDLPDPADRHVLAAARKAGAGVIVTLNLRDFPRTSLAALGLRAEHPDAFLLDLWLANSAAVETAVGRVAAQAAEIAGAPKDLRALLKKAYLPRLGKALSRAPQAVASKP